MQEQHKKEAAIYYTSCVNTICWKAKKRVFFFLLGISFLSFLLLLRFGNSQWSRYIYIYQAYISPTYANNFIPPPPNYSGKWRTWTNLGTLTHILHYKCGKLEGMQKAFYGLPFRETIFTETIYSNGHLTGLYRRYRIDGALWIEGKYIKGKPVGIWKHFEDNGNIKIENHNLPMHQNDAGRNLGAGGKQMKKQNNKQ